MTRQLRGFGYYAAAVLLAGAAMIQLHEHDRMTVLGTVCAVSAGALVLAGIRVSRG